MRVEIFTRFLLVCVLVATLRVCPAEERGGGTAALPEGFRPATFQKHVAYLASDELAGRAPGTEGSAQAADYVVRHFVQYGLEKLAQNGSWYQEFPLRSKNGAQGDVTARNILAVLPGRGKLKDEAIVVCAHYDHLGAKSSEGSEGEDTIYNGADDNASGVAALLMVADALRQERRSLPESHRSIVFVCFDGEERGLVGSNYYVQHPLWPLERTAAVINFDGVGRLRLGKVYASDAETSPLLAEAARKAATDVRLVAETRFGGHNRSDHSIFLDRGIPGVHFFTGANIDYHQVSDELEHLNCEGGAAIAGLAFRVLQEATACPGRIEYRELEPSFDMTFTLNLVRTLGIIPNVGTQDGRYPHILFVVPKSPAAEVGLKSNDRITAVNGLQFERVEDALFIFQQLTFEDGLRLSILRADEEMEVHIPASVFTAMAGPQATRLPSGKYEVVFEYTPGPGFQAVYLAGEFNDWQPKALQMDGPDENDLYTARLELDEGTYQYKFVIEGEHWESDPKNMHRVGKYNNSLLWVGRLRQ